MHYQNSESNSRRVGLILFGLILFVVILSLGVFSRQSLRLDEAQSLWQTSHSPLKIFNIVAQDVHVPLYHLILHFWQIYLGNTVLGGRLLSLLFFIASIPALYLLGKRAFGSKIALFATILFAISPFVNWYGNEIRMYSLLTLVTILSQYFFIGIYCRESDSWAGYFITGFIGIFVHYFFWFVLLVQAIFFLVYRHLFPKGSFKRFVIIALIYLAVFAPWIIYVKYLGSISNTTPELPIPTTVNVFNTFSQFVFGFQNDHLNTILVSLWPITVLIGFLALRTNKKVSPETIYMIMSFLIPIAAAFIVSVVLQPLFVSRYLILTVPAMYLLIGWIFSTYPPNLRQTVQSVLIVAMLVALVIEIVNPSAPIKEDYQDAASYLDAHATSQDVIILSAPFTVYPVEYYYKGPAEIETLPIWNRFVTGPIPPFNEAALPDQVNTIKSDHQTAWVLLSYNQGYEEKIRLYMDTHFQRTYVKQFSPDLTLYAYRLRYDPSVLPPI